MMRRFKYMLAGLMTFVVVSLAEAQSINQEHVYWLNNDTIYDYNPAAGTYRRYYFNCPVNAHGLAIAPDIKRRERLTFYTTVDGKIQYFDGSKWINTNHSSESVNIAGGGDYIYILDGIHSRIYRYDGKGDATLIMEFATTFEGPFDLVCDKAGNFYIINVGTNKFAKYDPNGVLLKEYDIAGLSGQNTGGGFAFIKEVIYANFSGTPMIGKFENGKFNFEIANSIEGNANDFANVPAEVFDPLIVEQVDTTPPPPEDVTFTEGNIPVTIKDRNVELQTSVTVNSTEFEIEIYDKSVVDGDSISLNLNGVWILEDFAVIKTKYRMKVKIDPKNSNNYLILYALNLGTISPNTAAVSVLVDGKEYKLSLSSDLNTSGALNFVYVPKE